MKSGEHLHEDTRLWPTIGLLDWSHLIEDFLDNLGVSFEHFRKEFRGSWIFGYIDALRLAGVRPVWFCVSARVAAPYRFTHIPTGAQVCVLPTPRSYRMSRRWVLNPYAPTVEQAAGDVHGIRRAISGALKETMPYLATPLRLLARELRRECCSAVMCQEYEHPRFDACVLLGQLMRLPVFATFQGGNWQLSRLERLLRPLTLRSCAGLIIATQSEVERVCTRYGLPRTSIARIFNPIDLGTWYPEDRAEARSLLGIPMNCRLAVWHGRVDLHRKGLDILLDAWEQVRRERSGQDLRLLLVGTGNNADELGRRITSMQSSSILWIDKFVGDPAAIRRYLSAADVYAFPSRHEGFPVAPIEATACGLPLVAADAPGIPDILEDGEGSGGVVVRRGDAAALAKALGRILDDEDWSRELGKRARRRVENFFSLERIGQQLRDFLVSRGMQIPLARQTYSQGT